ncbi:MAG: hypothetical protein K2J65_10915 [Duncaniella sp.]|nr:hypothetical protein [Duncaniella sp.]
MKKVYSILFILLISSISVFAQKPQHIKVMVRGMVVMDTIVNGNDEIVILDLTSPSGSAKTHSTNNNVPQSSNGNVRSQAYSTSKSTKQSGWRQCAATTKKGTRCSRQAKAGSSYCWQHQ